MSNILKQIREGYKQTKVGIIPDKWQKIELSEVLTISSKKFNPIDNNENKKCIELEHLSQETGKLLGYANSNKQKSIKNSFKEGQVLFGKLRPYLKKFWKAEFEGVCSSEIWVMSGKKVKNDFLFYLVQTEKFNQIANISSGSKMPRADWNYMANISFNIPPLKEQEKIAEILTTWDDAIELQEKLVDEKETLKKGLMQKLLSGEVHFSEFSDEWEEVKLGEIGEFKTSSIDKIINKNEKLVNLINYMDVYRNKHIDKNFKCSITSLREEQYEKVNLKKGDILFTPSSETPDDIGHSAVIIEDLPNTVYSYHLVRFRPKKSIDINFSGYVFNNSNILKEFARKATGSTRFTLSIKDFNEINAKLPSLAEQNKIAEALSTADKEIELLKNELDELKLQKKGLMQKLLTGDVRVVV